MALIQSGTKLAYIIMKEPVLVLPSEGVEHALDHIFDSFNSVAYGTDDRLHHGWLHSYPAGLLLSWY